MATATPAPTRHVVCQALRDARASRPSENQAAWPTGSVMENAQIADIFDEIADLLELSGGDPFRVRAYRGAAQTIRGLPRRLEDLLQEGADLRELPHIGASTAEKIREILRTGTCRRLLELRRKVPRELTSLMKVPQVGPRRARLLYEKLGIRSLEELRAACEQHRVRTIRTFGPKSEENILRGLATLQRTSGRMLLRSARDYVESLERHLRTVRAITRWQVAGSYRRQKETIGDLDIIVEAADREQATRGILRFPGIEQILSRGSERLTVRVGGGLQVDFRFVDPPAFGAALMYFTGSKTHNIALRRLVQQHGWKLNEYGLFRGRRRIAGASEEEVYAKLGLRWIPPELREDRGEIQAAARGDLPDLIEVSDIRGELHAHTSQTDGLNTIEEMAEAARQRGYEYLAITDHSQAVTVARGLNETGLRRHVARIRKVGARLKGLWLLAGVEVDILRDGRLDLDEKLLAELDWVVASVHSHFDMPARDMTRRLLRAVRSGVVHCIGHPAGRIIGRRDPIDLDWERLFAACAEHGVRLEINAQPDRMDLPDVYCQQARQAGVGFVIGTDAHKPADFDFLPLGAAVARRGWLTAEDVLNTLPADRLRATLKRR